MGGGKSRDNRLIIANCSGFFGDRLSAAAEMVRGGHIDFLTGDYLAELTMAILFRTRMKDPSGGYASTFLKQMEEVMGECLDRGIKVVSNGGGLNPRGLAEELEKVAERLGLHPEIAFIEGDDLMQRLGDLQEEGETLTHMDSGISLSESGSLPITANAYMGCAGIVRALEQGADIVVGGRIADASLVTGPAAWHFGWDITDLDALAGATTAGHIIECGAQATGGNYSFFEEVPSFTNIGFPIAEVHEDGSFVITKHPGTGGLVSVDTVKAQLLYEIRDERYLSPDVVARFDTISISQKGEDRVLVSGVKGEPAPDTVKVCINNMAGYRNSMTVVLTGLDIEKKAEIVEKTLFEVLGGREQFAVSDVQLIRSQKEDPLINEEAFAYLRLSVMDPDRDRVGRLFSGAIVELALANIPGFTLTSPPSKGSPAIQHWPALISAKQITQTVHVKGTEIHVRYRAYPGKTPFIEQKEVPLPPVPKGKKVKTPLGRLFASRSGDKGGNANLGVWARTPEAYAFLREYLTVDKLKKLLADLEPYEIERCELPNLLALNFYIKGILGEGVAASVRFDPQAKTLAEYLRAKKVPIPAGLLG